MIFSEGAREFADGKMLPFKNGAVRLALQAGVPILPVTVSGGSRIWPRSRKYLTFSQGHDHIPSIVGVSPHPDESKSI
ncbi:MAG: 1-acyl-sn-glycerol-3-phosphate acyltransferase [Chloracidobacterium sp.]|nr:1-acyl-sn-glycerol-3-phosphate acyltransferase [Chloracidobacterium sp.]